MLRPGRGHFSNLEVTEARTLCYAEIYDFSRLQAMRQSGLDVIEQPCRAYNEWWWCLHIVICSVQSLLFRLHSAPDISSLEAIHLIRTGASSALAYGSN